AYVNLMLRAFYAEKDTRTPVRAALVSFVLNVGLSLVLMKPLSTLGLALASNLAVVAQAIHLQRALSRRRPQLGVVPMLPSLGNGLAGSLGMGLGGAGVRRWVAASLGNVGGVLLRLIVLVPCVVAIYAVLAWLLRLDGRDELLGLLRGRKPRAASAE